MTVRIASGTVNQYVYFNAGVPGLSSFTVNRSRNGGTWTTMTTPTVAELGTNTGVYSLLLDEDMSLDAGDSTQAMCFLIEAAGMPDQFIQIELFRPTVTEGETLTVSSGVGESNLIKVAGGPDITASGTGNQQYGE